MPWSVLLLVFGVCVAEFPMAPVPGSDEDPALLNDAFSDDYARQMGHPYYQQQPSMDLARRPSNQELFRHFDSHLLPDDVFGDMPKSDTVKCFSCMSKFYEAVWPALAHVYKKPLNFTDYCNDDQIDQTKVKQVACPTICVAMSEESTVAGMKIRGHIRGCLGDLLHNGFNQTIVSWYRWMHRDSCRIYRKRELFKLAPEQSDESSIQVCTCYADYCNSSPDAATRPTQYVLFVVLLSAFARLLA